MLKPIKFLFLFIFFLTALFQNINAAPNIQQLGQTYVERWIEFYPSEAFTYGNTDAAWRFENFSEERVTSWLEHNRQVYKLLSSANADLSINQSIDARVLRRQTLMELERWQYDKVLANQAMYYAELISQALTYLLVRDQFKSEEKIKILIARIRGVQSLSELGLTKLKNGSQQRTRRAIGILKQTIEFYENNLPEIATTWTSEKKNAELEREIGKTAFAIKKLVNHINEQILPTASIPDKFSSVDYARKLKVYVDSDLSPEQLKQSALRDINETRKLMSSMATSWWHEKRHQTPIPDNENELLQAVMTAMENDRNDNRKDFLQFFIDFQ